jgi:hypothetical protein
MSNVAKIDIGLRVENLGDNVVTDHAWMVSGLTMIQRQVVYMSKSSAALTVNKLAGRLRPKCIYLRLVSTVCATLNPGVQIWAGSTPGPTRASTMHLSKSQAMLFKPYSTQSWRMRASTATAAVGAGVYVEFVAFGV